MTQRQLEIFATVVSLLLALFGLALPGNSVGLVGLVCLAACLCAFRFSNESKLWPTKPKPVLDDSCPECGGTQSSWIDGRKCQSCPECAITVLPDIRTERRCVWEFPEANAQQQEAVQGPRSESYPCGYSPEAVASLQSTPLTTDMVLRESFQRFWARWEETHGGKDAWMYCSTCGGSGLDAIWCGDCPACSIPGVITGGSGRVLKPLPSEDEPSRTPQLDNESIRGQ